MYLNRGGRHYNFAKHLVSRGYDVTIFCADTLFGLKVPQCAHHDLLSTKISEGIRFVFIRTTPYTGNGLRRIINMFSFYRNVKKAAKKFKERIEVPDIIVASSVHPLTLIAGQKTAQKMNIPCICEIRDLWPESIIDYGFLRRGSFLAKYLYRRERNIYEKADQLIFTVEGAFQYILDKGWDLKSGGQIDLKDVHYINNGVDLVEFDKNASKHKGYHSELFLHEGLNFIYTGAIRSANNLELIIRPFDNAVRDGLRARLIIVGSGDQLEYLKGKYSSKEQRVIFTGRLEKEYMPALLAQSDVCVLCSTQVPLNRYGISQNKLFEYMAAGKPILSLAPSSYDPIRKYGIGFYPKDQSVEGVELAIWHYCSLAEKERDRMRTASREAAKDFDFRVLTGRLIEVIESTQNN